MNIKQGNLENIILNALWDFEENFWNEVDVANIQLKINTNTKKWAYTTVKTVLDRLAEKNLVTRNKQGKKYYYNSRISRITAGEEAIKKMTKQYYKNNIDELLKAVEKIQNEAVLITR